MFAVMLSLSHLFFWAKYEIFIWLAWKGWKLAWTAIFKAFADFLKKTKYTLSLFLNFDFYHNI